MTAWLRLSEAGHSAGQYSFITGAQLEVSLEVRQSRNRITAGGGIENVSQAGVKT